MAFANVDIGAQPADGTGDPIRVAFSKINQNFANIAAGDITVNAPVKSVAGRTGNVRLIVNDIGGAASNVAVNAANVAARAYTDTAITNFAAQAPVTITGMLQLPTYTNVSVASTAVNNSPANGMVYYDVETGKIRAFAAGVWVDLH